MEIVYTHLNVYQNNKLKNKEFKIVSFNKRESFQESSSHILLAMFNLSTTKKTFTF
jgi:hypothetical protein